MMKDERPVIWELRLGAVTIEILTRKRYFC